VWLEGEDGKRVDKDAIGEIVIEAAIFYPDTGSSRRRSGARAKRVVPDGRLRAGSRMAA
jgi:hypothetical protein